MKLFLIAFLYVAVGTLNIANAHFEMEGQDSEDEYVKILSALTLDDLRNTMMETGSDGLNPRRYWTEDMEWYYQQGVMAQSLKDQATQNYLRLLQDISLGIVDPETMGPDIKMQRKKFISAKQLRVLLLASGTQAGPLLASVSPHSAQYLALKEALKRIANYCTRREWMPLVSPPTTLRLGSIDQTIPAIKNRLKQYGYPITTDTDIFDEEVLAAVTDIQWMLRLKPDGMIKTGGKTWSYIDASCLDRLRQIRHDMEKLRWFQQTFEDRYIFVNLAMSFFTLVDKTSGTLNTMVFRTINGRPARSTPTMRDRIVTVIINPYWVVPPTIFREDKIEELKNMTKEQIAEYFSSRHYEVWNSSFTQQYDPTSIDWKNLDLNADKKFYIRQRPHLGNALGVLKFLLTNHFAIYLHDTNQRDLFAEGQRLLSSGCVRLERPLDLAEYLLNDSSTWTREVIEQAMAKPGEVMDGETKVPLSKPMPLYLVFLTSQLNADGVIRFVEDSYHQNNRLLEKGVW